MAFKVLIFGAGDGCRFNLWVSICGPCFGQILIFTALKIQNNY